MITDHRILAYLFDLFFDQSDEQGQRLPGGWKEQGQGWQGQGQPQHVWDRWRNRWHTLFQEHQDHYQIIVPHATKQEEDAKQ